MIPYAIASPQYSHTSGGIKVMWGLYGHLLARGHEVYMNAYPTTGKFIAIYPETYPLNVMPTKKVARYILNKVGVMGVGKDTNNLQAGPTEFEDGAMLYYFSRLFGETDDNHYMFLPVINTDIFIDQKKIRDKRAVFVGKGDNLELHPKGAYVVDRSLAQDQQELADFLNECEVLYSYDPVSAMSEVARLCGTRVVIYNDEYSEEDYRTKYEPGSDGLSFMEDTHIPLDVEGFRGRYMSLKDMFNTQLDKFVEDTQK